jgi:hypothetical protein
MAKPDAPPGQQKTFTVTHPTDPTSPKEVTQEQWREDQMGKAGWTKVDDPDEVPHPDQTLPENLKP